MGAKLKSQFKLSSFQCKRLILKGKSTITKICIQGDRMEKQLYDTALVKNSDKNPMMLITTQFSWKQLRCGLNFQYKNILLSIQQSFLTSALQVVKSLVKCKQKRNLGCFRTVLFNFLASCLKRSKFSEINIRLCKQFSDVNIKSWNSSEKHATVLN